MTSESNINLEIAKTPWCALFPSNHIIIMNASAHHFCQKGKTKFILAVILWKGRLGSGSRFISIRAILTFWLIQRNDQGLRDGAFIYQPHHHDASYKPSPNSEILKRNLHPSEMKCENENYPNVLMLRNGKKLHKFNFHLAEALAV